MKLCKDCRFVSEGTTVYCSSPKLKQLIHPGCGDTHIRCHQMNLRAQPSLYGQPVCGPDGMWFELRLIDPGDGWRLLNKGEKIQAGDEFFSDITKTWSKDVSVGQIQAYPLFYRRSIVPALAKCPEGHETKLWECADHTFVVRCQEPLCSWQSCQKPTQHEAAEAWNKAFRK